jgi:hypothetical protein
VGNFSTSNTIYLARLAAMRSASLSIVWELETTSKSCSSEIPLLEIATVGLSRATLSVLATPSVETDGATSGFT